MKKTNAARHCSSLACVLWLSAFASASLAAEWFPYPADATEPPLAADGKRVPVDYVALPKASRKWHVCVAFPHVKDAYWLGVNYGVVQEARRVGVRLSVVEAGGYTMLNRQIEQIESCVSRGADAMIVGGISADGLSGVVREVSSRNVPVIDLVNGIRSPLLTAKSLVSFHTMGHEAGSYLAARHPAGGDTARVAWFPGPQGAGWVEAAHRGFIEAVQGSALQILPARYGDTGREVQARLIQEALEAQPDIDYVAGTAVTIEAAVELMRTGKLDSRIKLVSLYLTPRVYDAIASGAVLASPADSMVIQGRIAVDQAVRALEKQPMMRHVGPRIIVVDQQTLKAVKRENVLPPRQFKAVYKVD